MKAYPLKLLTVALAVDIGCSFVPSNLNPRRSIVGPAVSHTTTHRFATSLEVGSSGDATFPYDNDAIRFAYDEWRFQFGKRSFDPARFESFKANFKTLTIANLQARDKAYSEGRQPPAWMNLNEYGDFSMEEYEATKRPVPMTTPISPPPPPPSFQQPPPPPMQTQASFGAPALQQNQAPPVERHIQQSQAPMGGNTVPSSNLISEDIESIKEMEKAFEYVSQNTASGPGPLDPGQVKRESRLRALYQACPKAYQVWCATYLKEPDAIRFATFSYNYVAMRQFAEKFGKELKLNKYADCTKGEYTRLVYGPLPEEIAKQRAVEEAKIAIQRAEAARLAEKQAAGQRAAEQRTAEQKNAVDEQNYMAGNNMSYGAPSQTGEYQDQYGRTIRPTQVVQTGQNPRRTDLIEDAQPPESRRRTMFIPETSATSAPPRGTEVIKRADQPPVRPTEVIRTADQRPARRTVLIDENKRSTELIDGESLEVENPEIDTPVRLPDSFGPVRPTIVMDKKTAEAQGYAPGETREQPEQSTSPTERGTFVLKSNQPEQSTSPTERGTFVLKSNQPEQSPSPTERGTFVLKSNQPEQSASPTERGTFVLKSDQPDDTPARGTTVIRKNNGEPVRGTVVVKKKGQDSGAAPGTQVVKSRGQEGSARGTLIISKSEQESGNWPLNFPFFGSSDEDDDLEEVGSRGTVVIKRQIPEPKATDNPFGFGLFGSPNEKKVDSDRGTVVIKKSQPEAEAPSVFSFFGGTKKSKTPSRSVRGTIVLQKNGRTPKKPSGSGRQTVLINKSELGGTVPSIFSFFGGAKKNEEEAARDPNSRATLVIKKPRNDWRSALSMFGGSASTAQDAPQTVAPTTKDDAKAAQLERQRVKMLEMHEKREAIEAQKEQRRRELQERRLEAAKARKERIVAKSMGTPAQQPAAEKKQPFSFFGNPGASKPAPKEVPEVKRWKQNADGTITGFIYKSKNFKDGTRVTTSPVPVGSKRGSVVRTGSGNQYALK